MHDVPSCAARDVAASPPLSLPLALSLTLTHPHTLEKVLERYRAASGALRLFKLAVFVHIMKDSDLENGAVVVCVCLFRSVSVCPSVCVCDVRVWVQALFNAPQLLCCVPQSFFFACFVRLCACMRACVRACVYSGRRGC